MNSYNEWHDETGRYPSDAALAKIQDWPSDWYALMSFIQGIWEYADWGWSKSGNKYNISTGGWSGNEDIIHAMQHNFLFWSLCWYSSKRGGHYEFRVR
jgi:hypothetical protein